MRWLFVLIMTGQGARGCGSLETGEKGAGGGEGFFVVVR